jgi:energy-coupling factor transporter ATP-binding protein EcfA2
VDRKPIGVVVASRRNGPWTEVVLVLTPEELDRGERLLLGEFVQVSFDEKDYVGMVLDGYYEPVATANPTYELALAHVNQVDLEREDPWARKRINFYHHRIAILGRVLEKGDFAPSTRLLPPVVEARVYRMDERELGRLLAAEVKAQGKGEREEKRRYAFGHLAYGLEEKGEHPEAVKEVDPQLFVGKRTANFGKTGFGKSNENKVILTLLAHAFPEVGMLILDQNAEYLLQTESTTSQGLAQAFKALGIRGRIRFYTKKEEAWEKRLSGHLGSDWGEYVEIRPLKVDFYQFPDLAISLAYHRRQLEGTTPPQYLENAYHNIEDWKGIPNRMAYVYGAFRKAGLLPRKGFRVRYRDEEYELADNKAWSNLKKSLDLGSQGGKKASSSEDEEGGDDGGARKLYTWAKAFSFLKAFHAPGREGNFIETVVRDLLEEEGKVIVLDLPSLGDGATFFVQRLMTSLFERAIELYGERQANFVVVLEEAHNVLEEEGSIFYRVAKEGRKYGIGMLYSTQSPASIPMEILSQTENFLVKHLSSEEDVKALKKAKAPFALVTDFLLSEPIIGYSYVYFEPYQPFVVPLRVKLLESVLKELGDGVS